MGYERFNITDYSTYRSTNSYETKSQAEIFTSRMMPAKLDPAKAILRESCDSAVNPYSTPIILGLDVTGSMGFVAEEIAREGLAPLMETIYKEKPVTDPQVMFMGIGDVRAYDRAPLQVSQFEAGAIPLIEQLSTLFLEKGGGGNQHESYDLPWYYAANHTKIDCFDKRGEKGYLFTIGDEPAPPEPLTADELYKVFQTRDIPQYESTQALLTDVQERYKVFHIVAEQGSFYSSRPTQVEASWDKLLGPNVVYMRDVKRLADIVVATLKIANGEDIYDVIETSNCPSDLRHAFKNALSQQG